jgi:hypothetical protein
LVGPGRPSGQDDDNEREQAPAGSSHSFLLAIVDVAFSRDRVEVLALYIRVSDAENGAPRPKRHLGLPGSGAARREGVVEWLNFGSTFTKKP